MLCLHWPKRGLGGIGSAVGMQERKLFPPNPDAGNKNVVCKRPQELDPGSGKVGGSLSSEDPGPEHSGALSRRLGVFAML